MMDNLQPIYRIEDFWYAIVNGLSCPHTPIYRIEQYLAYLCGADVSVPQPIYRIEQYLAYKCGLDVELPEPIYRQEMFLAKWCGMDVEPPTPIYRIEVLLSQLSNGYLHTETGNPISVSDALAKPAESLTIEILPQQDLNGYDNPWPAGGGVNLIDFDSIFTEGWTNTVDDVTATYSKGYMRVVGTSSKSSGYTNVVSIEPWISENLHFGAGDYVMSEHLTIRCKIDGSASYYNKSTAFSASSSVDVRGFYIAISAGQTVDWNIPMVFCKGTTIPTTYSPYENLCPISGHTGVKVWRTWKNLADPSEFSIEEPSYSPQQYWLGLTDNGDGTYTETRPLGLGGTGFVYVGTFKAGTYSISADVKDLASVTCGLQIYFKRKGTWYDATQAYVNSNITVLGRYGISKTITEDFDIWLVVAPYNTKGAQVKFGDIQVELGSTATAYEPYQGTSVEVALGQTVYGGTLDVTTGVLTKAPYYDSYNGEPLVGPWVSSMDKYVPGATPTTGAQVVDLGGTGTDVQLSATEVQMLLGNNVIWNDVGDMVLEYLADGPADDIDALNILLNNRYVNNGEPDEATDKEALEILLGGNTR